MLCSCNCFICSANSCVQVCSCSFSEERLNTCYSKVPFFDCSSLIMVIRESEVYSSPEEESKRFKMSLLSTRFFSRSLIWLWSFFIKAWSTGFELAC
jgi:hypothetical protein